MKPHQLEFELYDTPTLTYEYDISCVNSKTNFYWACCTVKEDGFAILFIQGGISGKRKWREALHSLALLLLYTRDSRPFGDEFSFGSWECSYLID